MNFLSCSIDLFCLLLHQYHIFFFAKCVFRISFESDRVVHPDVFFLKAFYVC